MKVLIVEDDIDIAELQRDYLEMAGFDVAIETDGRQGLQRAQRETFAAIILDVMLPSLTGFDILRELRQQQQTPILFVSARQDDIDKVRGLGLGADDYMTKPFSPHELVARVKAHIERFNRLVQTAAPTPKRAIHYRELTIYPTEHRVVVRDTDVTLTGKEFDLLVLLMTNPGRVYGKEELFDRIWGMDALGDYATVTVHIRKLREKIERNPSEPEYIETVWGVGYRGAIVR